VYAGANYKVNQLKAWREMKMKKIIALILSVMMLTLAACGGSGGGNNSNNGGAAAESAASNGNAPAASDGGVYVLGSSQPLTGTNALPGECALNAVKLAVKMINEEGGFQGNEIKLVSYDDQGSPEEAVKVATKLVEVDNCDAIIGSCISSCVLSGGEMVSSAGIPMFGTGTSPTWMQQGWDYVFRACQNNDFALPSVVDALVELGVTKVAIFAGQDDAAVAGSNTFQDLAKAAGIEITTAESYVEGDTDYSGQVAKMINSGAEVMFISTFGPTQPLIAKQLRQYGFNGLCFTKDLYQVDALQVAGAASNNFAFAYPYLTYTDPEECDIPVVRSFLEAYQTEYGELPTSDCAYRAWDSVMVLKEAINLAGTTDREAVAKAVGQVKGLETLAGVQDFTLGDGEGLHSSNIFIIENEKYILFDKWLENGGWEALK